MAVMVSVHNDKKEINTEVLKEACYAKTGFVRKFLSLNVVEEFFSSPKRYL